MANIVFKSASPKQASEFLMEALKSEKSRILHCLQLAEERLRRYEKKYNVPSEKFMREWSSEDLEGKDLEYVEWAGEMKLADRLKDQLGIISGIEYAA